MADFPDDFRIADEVRARLSRQTALLQSWAEQTPEPRFTDLRWDAPVGRFGPRLRMVLQRGLFLDGRVAVIGLDSILQMAARLAYRVHGLNYDEKRARWVLARSEPTPFKRRAPAYLDLLSQNDVGYPPPPANAILRQSIPKVDMALIAHCFQTPIEIWDAWDDRFFIEWLDRVDPRAPADRSIFAYGDVDYLLNFATESNDLDAREITTALRGVVAERFVLPSLPADRPLRFKLPLPKDINPAEVMLFEYDHQVHELALLSTTSQTGGCLVYSNAMDIPRAGSIGGGVVLSSSKESTLLALLVDPKAFRQKYHGRSSLAEFSFFASGKLTTLSGSEIGELRELIFRMPTDYWRLLKRRIAITP